MASTLREEYQRAVSALVQASEAIDKAKGVAKNNAKLDFVIAQQNVLSVQMLMILEVLNGLEAKKGGKKDE